MPYIGKSTDGLGIRERFTYVASVGATSISGADANGKSLLFEDPEYVDVFLNGVRLKKGTDYNTDTANTIASLAALAEDDEVEVIVTDVFTLADMVSANTGGDFRGNIAIQKDSGVISFGADREITLTHDADKGLKLKNTSTTGNSGVGTVLTLQTGDTDIASGNVLGDIQFQAPDEGTGTDAILVAAAIKAMSEGDFSSSSNATKLSFHTASSAAAAETMSLSSGGNLTVSGTYTGGGLMTTGGSIVIPDGGNIGSASDTNAIAISSAGVVTISTNTDSTSSTSGALIAHSAGFADDVFIGDDLEVGGGVIALKNTGSQSELRLYCESSNAHYAALKAPAHSDFSGNVDLLLPAVTDTLVGIAATQTLTNKTLTSPKINENVAVTSTATELNLLDGVTATTAEINFLDGGSTIGTTAIADGDGIIHNDGGTMKVTTAATFKTYFQAGLSSAADDISAGDAAVNITTSSGNITIDAAANDSDIIFKGTDNSSDITMLTLDGSDAGTAIFNHDIKIADDGQIGSASAADAMIISSAGIVTFKDDILIKDGGTIGSASDADAITIAANGQLTLTQTLIGTALDISGDIDVDGTTNLDVVDIDGAVDMASTLQVDGAITSSAGATITTADNTAQLVLKSTDADSSSGPRLELNRDSGSPANADNIGLIVWKADDDGGNSTEVIQMLGVVEDVTNGSEYGSLDVRTMVAGNTTSRAFYDITETVFNDGGADLNFRIEGDSLTNLFVCDAGQEAIAMGDANPTRHGKTTRLLCYQGSGTGTDFALHVGRVGTGAESQVCFSNGYGEVGSIKTNGTSTSFNTSSDYRLKENVVDMTGAMDRVNKLLPRRFNFKVDTDTTLDGFVAHEVAEVVPEAISGEKDGVNGDGSINPQGIDQAKLVPLLTGALKEAITKIESLETRIKTLEDA